MLMKHAAIILIVSMLALAFTGCAGKPVSRVSTEKIEGSSLYVKKVENMPDDFILGMDASSVIAEENSGVKYYDFEGNEQDVFVTLAESGVNTIRVRVWNDPYDEEGHGFGGGNNGIETAIEIGKRATAAGMRLLVDFHLSDFWADPGKQMVPRAWKGMTIEQKTAAVHDFVRDSLKALKKNRIDVCMVQIGNETNGALAGETTWFNMRYLMQAGSEAVREVFPSALVALHFANPEHEGSYENYAKKLAEYEVDYDVFASSYYPYWHGTLDNLSKVLNGISARYGKKVMVMETSYAYTAEDTDFNGNTIGDGGNVIKPYPFTVQGQANLVRDVIDTVVNGMTDGIGVVYWEGTWISVGQNSWEENHKLWEEFGSGWASSYAAAYDPVDAGKYYGGCAVDNQAMFGPDGRPFESLRVFNLARYGNETEIKADAIEDAILYVDLNGTITLPETVNAIMNDDSRQPVAVKWDADEALFDLMYKGGVATYEITGEADGLPAKCTVNMIEYNFLQNHSFEDGELGAWRVIERGNADQLFVESKPTDSKTGEYHMHFWSAAKNSVDFSLEQDVEGLEAGEYKFTISIMGGDSGAAEIYAYALVDGEEVGRAEMSITYYGAWDTVTVSGINVAEGQTVTVGISVKCEGAGNGAWGKIDDAMLNSVG
ncbi:MAG: glycosyl hydrolase 53 family protein [Clostridia bacterium]|nr:glycosyl hydrolase 53 family protein [Clostridia bacterium]